MDLLLDQKVDQVLLARLMNDCEVAPVNDIQIGPELASLGDDVTEAVLQLGGATGYVEGGDARGVLEKGQALVGCDECSKL